MSHPTVYRLSNQVQHYDWGSHTDIGGLLGTPDSGRPEAELWLGAHNSAPSMAQPWHDAAATPIPLNQLIQQYPVETLGNRVLDEFGPRLPYLLKVLAADRALSLQVHPASHLARAGFNRENREKIPIDAPYRNFKDENHKPEMVVAVTEFHALAGLRAPRVILRMLDGLTGPLFDLVRNAITAQPNPNGIRAAMTALLAQREATSLVSELAEAVASIKERILTGSQYEVADQTAIDLAEQYPGDVGALSSYLLNRVTLLPGEALYLGDGEVHAYLKGLGVEIMANSDNVLRAGLTTKHVDVPALLECMSFSPKMPFRPEPFELGESSRSFSYRPPSPEFALTMIDLHGEPLPVHASGPRILLVMDGDIVLTYGGAIGLDPEIPKITGFPLTALQLKRGDSIFIPDAIGAIQVAGAGQVACGWVP